MRKLFILVLLLVTFGVIADNGKVRKTHWERIQGMPNKDITIYVDVSTLKEHIEKDDRHGFGMILFKRKSPTEIDVDGDKIQTNQFARYFVVDCNNALAAPLADFYFNLPRLPIVTDVPLKAMEYPEDNLTVIEVSKENAIFKTLCPNYI